MNEEAQSPSPSDAAPSPELQQVLCDLQSPDDWTRASAVRALCPCRRKDWGEPVYRYVIAMRDDPSPIVRGAVRHDLTENRRWNESWEAALIQERRARRRKVTLAAPATSLSDLCAHLRATTGIPLVAGEAVAGEAVTLFCGVTPLRDVMRQLTRALAYDWVWHYEKEGECYFELTRAGRTPGEPRASDGRESAADPARLARDRALKHAVSLGIEAPSGRVNLADLLTAIHRATGLSIISDAVAPPSLVENLSLQDRPLFDVLNRIAEGTGTGWQLDDVGWLRFRNAPSERRRRPAVPDRFLTAFAESRRRHGALTLDDLVEIACLPQAALVDRRVVEEARETWGLEEWPLAVGGVRSHLQYLAGFTPDQRARATSSEGLPFVEMSPAQQNRFLTIALGADGMATMPPEELSGAVLRVDYSVPGGYEWRVPGPAWLSSVVPLAPGPHGRRVLCPIVREPTPDAALAALARVDPEVRSAVLAAAGRADPRLRDASPPDALQIAPTRLRLAFVYLPSATNRRAFVTCVATPRGCRITRARW